MIDIHCHILPAMDDGSADMEESVAMAKIAAADGIRSIVATPHFIYDEKSGAAEIARAVASLRQRLKKEGVPVTLFSGADIKLRYELLEGIEKRDIPMIGGSRYFLLELPEIIPPNLDTVLHTAAMHGLVPIITHPERNYSLLSAPKKMDAMKESGALFQITAMSITGKFGTRIKNFSLKLLKNGFVDFVATDSHGAIRRRPVLSNAYKIVSSMLDEARVKKIFFENPEAVIGDREIR